MFVWNKIGFVSLDREKSIFTFWMKNKFLMDSRHSWWLHYKIFAPVSHGTNEHPHVDGSVVGADLTKWKMVVWILDMFKIIGIKKPSIFESNSEKQAFAKENSIHACIHSYGMAAALTHWQADIFQMSFTSIYSKLCKTARSTNIITLTQIHYLQTRKKSGASFKT